MPRYKIIGKEKQSGLLIRRDMEAADADQAGQQLGELVDIRSVTLLAPPSEQLQRSSTRVLDLSGESGSSGDDGRSGSSGNRGQEGEKGLSKGTSNAGDGYKGLKGKDGGNGSEGGRGEDGGKGQSGKPGRFLKAELVLREDRLCLVCDHGEEVELNKYEALLIKSNGGDGGRGGDGGDGGRGGSGGDGGEGGKGGNASLAKGGNGGSGGDGGDGGNGGDGGDGGNGGDGGTGGNAADVQLYCRDARILALLAGVHAELHGGQGGEGGKPGSRGTGGMAGSAGSGGSYGICFAKGNRKVKPGRSGTRGKSGKSGNSGSQGRSGSPGRSGKDGHFSLTVHGSGEVESASGIFQMHLETEYQVQDDETGSVIAAGDTVGIVCTLENRGELSFPAGARLKLTCDDASPAILYADVPRLASRNRWETTFELALDPTLRDGQQVKAQVNLEFEDLGCVCCGSELAISIVEPVTLKRVHASQTVPALREGLLELVFVNQSDKPIGTDSPLSYSIQLDSKQVSLSPGTLGQGELDEVAAGDAITVRLPLTFHGDSLPGPVAEIDQEEAAKVNFECGIALQRAGSVVGQWTQSLQTEIVPHWWYDRAGLGQGIAITQPVTDLSLRLRTGLAEGDAMFSEHAAKVSVKIDGENAVFVIDEVERKFVEVTLEPKNGRSDVSVPLRLRPRPNADPGDPVELEAMITVGDFPPTRFTHRLEVVRFAAKQVGSLCRKLGFFGVHRFHTENTPRAIAHMTLGIAATVFVLIGMVSWILFSLGIVLLGADVWLVLQDLKSIRERTYRDGHGQGLG